MHMYVTLQSKCLNLHTYIKNMIIILDVSLIAIMIYEYNSINSTLDEFFYISNEIVIMYSQRIFDLFCMHMCEYAN